MTQYNIDLYEEEELGEDSTLTCKKFYDLLGALQSDTPLGEIVQIRAEKDKNIIKNFNSSQRRIWSDWKNRQNKKPLKISNEELKAREDQLWNMLKDFNNIKPR